MKTKFLLTAICYLLVSSFVFSQNNLYKYSDSTDIVIKGDEIKRFPSLNFIDAVNGLYPWVFAANPNVNDYQFVINGFLLTDVNSINLNDIDEIVFTRNSLHGELFPFSKAGVFFIKTKTPTSSKPEINFNTQINVIQNKNRQLFNDENPLYYSTVNKNINNGTEIFTNNHLSFSMQKNKLSIYASGRYGYQQFPKLNEYYIAQSSTPVDNILDTLQGNSTTKQNTYGFYLNATYAVSKNINVGLTADYSNDHSTTDTLYTENYFDHSPSSGFEYNSNNNIHSTSPINYYHIGAFMDWKIIKHLTNNLQFEYLNQKFHTDYTKESNGNNAVFGQFNSTNTGYTLFTIKGYNVKDVLNYAIVSNKKVELNVGAVFTLFKPEIKDSTSTYNTSSFGTNPPNWSYTASLISVKDNYTILQPYINFSFKKYFSLYGRWARILDTKSFKDVPSKDKSNYFAGLEMSLKNIFNIGKTFNALTLSSNYGNILANTTLNSQWLSQSNESVNYGTNSGIAGYYSTYPVYYPSYNSSLPRNELLSFNLYASFLNNKLHFNAEWSSHKFDDYYLIPIPSVTNYVIYISEKGTKTVQGLSFQIAANVADEKEVKWFTRASLLLPKTTADNIAKVDSLNTYQSQLNIGWQNTISFKQFFVQVNLLTDVNHKYYITTTDNYNRQIYVPKNKTDFMLSNILVGYDFKKISVFVQTRNLALSQSIKDNYPYYKYFGAGANFKF